MATKDKPTGGFRPIEVDVRPDKTFRPIEVGSTAAPAVASKPKPAAGEQKKEG